MRQFLIVLLAMLPTNALASISADSLFDLIIKGDAPAVHQALTEAIAEDAAATGEPERQRDLFKVFMLTHPAVSDFTENWLKAEPDSAFALTARGWHLYGMGWAMRGEATAEFTYPDAFVKMGNLHEIAFDLMDQATKADPTLLAASDGVVVIPQTLGNIDAIPVELDRIMAITPNRGSLMRAMLALSPQWGGRPEQVELLCGRYAPMITTLAGYDTMTCRVDAAYYADFRGGDQREAAHQMLMLIDHPVLDYARLMDAVDNISTPQQQVTILEKVMESRPLTIKEGEALDYARSDLAGAAVIETFPERDRALAASVAGAQREADRNPLNGPAVTRYISQVYRNAATNGGAVDRNDVEARLKKLLATVPYDGTAWLQLAQLTSDDGSLAGIEAAQPYFENAVVYSNYRYDVVRAMLRTKLDKILNPQNILKARDISGLSPTERAELDRVIHCPIIHDYVRLNLICMNLGRDGDSCADGAISAESPLQERLFDLQKSGSCTEEFLRSGPEDVMLSPNPVTF